MTHIQYPCSIRVIESLREIDHLIVDSGWQGRSNRLRILIKAVQQYFPEDGRPVYRGSVHRIAEALELAGIHEAFIGSMDLMSQKVPRLEKGVDDLKAETTTSNTARNVVFELSIAANLKQKGFSVELPKNPDVICRTGKETVFIQCKRPLHSESIRKNAKESVRQLNRDLAQTGDSSARGLVALSLSRVMNPGDKLFFAQDDDVTRNAIGLEVQSMIRDWIWQLCPDQRFAGVVVHLMTPARIGSLGDFQVVHQFVTFPNSPREKDLLERLLGE